jgi:hypothetical protein
MNELLGNLAYSGLGFLLGYLVGGLRAEVHEIRETVCQHPDHDEMSHDGTPDEQAGTEMDTETRPLNEKPWHKRFTLNVVIGALLILLSLYTVVSSTRLSSSDKDQAECFTTYNLQFIKAYQARAFAADQDRESFNRLMLTLDNPNPKVRRDAFETYLADVRKTDEQRKKTPLPVPPNPEKFCERTN